MSELIQKHIDRLYFIKDNIEVLIKEVIQENETLIDDLNISQLEEGKRSDGSFLPDYSPVSVQVYGKPAGPIKLFDQGGFYRGIHTKAFDNAFVMEDRDYKTAKLKREYGEDILGLSDENEEVLIKTILEPELIKKTKHILQA